MVITININPKKRLWITSMTNIPIEKQNSANPIIRFIEPPKKAYIIIIYAFLLYYYTIFSPSLCPRYSCSLFTESFKISSISLPAASFAFCSSSVGASLCAVTSFFAVNLFTKSGIISRTFVTPS